MRQFPRWVRFPHLEREDGGASTNLREVAPNLYVGAYLSAVHSARLIPWSVVVDFYGEGPLPPRGDKVRVIRFPFNDGTPFPPGYLDRVYRLVKDADGPVLLHCAAGLSRSASAAYAMLRVLHGMQPKEALRRVRLPGQGERWPMPETLESAEEWVQDKLSRTPR